MEIVLHHPQHGYYRQGNPLGADGDFMTSPEASPMFGEMVGIWCVEAWKVLGSPPSFVLLELGPGQGSLLQAALHFAQDIEGFTRAFKLYLLESSSTLRQEFSPKDCLFILRPILIILKGCHLCLRLSLLMNFLTRFPFVNSFDIILGGVNA